jgi:DNA invertase Pin-like site-specific DNA recombinase
VQVIGYTRVSTGEQAQSGAGLAAQHEAITKEAERRGWNLVAMYEDAGLSGGSLAARDGLSAALASLKAKNADALVISKVDRLSRSLKDFAGLLELSRRQGWALVALDIGVDTSTASGELIANVMASVGQWERRAISTRTKEALAIKKAEGVRLGRPRQVPEDVRERIRVLRGDGLSLRAIARTLDDDSVATGHGAACWRSEAVRRILNS